MRRSTWRYIGVAAPGTGMAPAKSPCLLRVAIGADEPPPEDDPHRRRTGRMFLAGSERPCRGDIVVIVNDNDKTLQVG